MKVATAHSNKLSIAVRAALALGMGVAFTTATFAQDADQTVPPPDQSQKSEQNTNSASTTQLQGVVVTGSRIRQVDTQTQQPVVVMTSEEIEKTGLARIGDVLSQMNIQGSPSMNSQNVGEADGIGQGGIYLDMRNLGTQRVLVLVNGRRWITDPQGRVDLSGIPSAAVERIEVLKDGASAIYGSDAVSGVVNIITRKNFQGAELRVHMGTTDLGDGTSQQYQLALGTVSEKSSLMMTLEYTKQGAMWSPSRRLTRYPIDAAHPNAGWQHVSGLGVFTSSQGTFALNELGADATNLANYHRVDPNNLPMEYQYNPKSDTQFRMPSELKSMYINGHYNFTDNVKFVANAMYSERGSVSSLNTVTIVKPFFRATSGLMSKDSIYNPTNEDIEFSVLYPHIPRRTDHKIQNTHLDLAMQGYFSVNDRLWDWDTGVTYNKMTGTSSMFNQLDLGYIQTAIGPSFINADGQPQCGTPSNPIPLGSDVHDCIPLNILAGPSALTPEQREHLYIVPTYLFGTKSVDYHADITGGLFDIPTGGQVSFAAGMARREVSGYSRSGRYKELAQTSTAANLPVNGEYAVNAGYIELSAPVLQDMPWAQMLSFDFARRYSRYSNFGSTTDDKASFEYKPFDDLLLRGTYSESFHAPTIEQVGGKPREDFSSYTDPCDAKFGATIYGDQLYKTCVQSLRAAGFPDPSNFRQEARGGGVTQTAVASSNHIFTHGPSGSLKPELGTTRTVGFVYSPHYVSGLNIGVDWWRIDLKDIINTASDNDVLRGCYQGNQELCSQFQRDPTSGQIVQMFAGLSNRGKARVEGYDVTFVYNIPETSVGHFRIRNQSTYLTKWDQQVKPDAPVEHTVGWDNWRIRSHTSLDWKKGNIGATWTVRYFSSRKQGCPFGRDDSCNMPDHVDPFHGSQPVNRIGAIAFSDLSFRWSTPWKGELTLGVKNIFDRSPPISAVLPAYDIDRFWFADYRHTF